MSICCRNDRKNGLKFILISFIEMVNRSNEYNAGWPDYIRDFVPPLVFDKQRISLMRHEARSKWGDSCFHGCFWFVVSYRRSRFRCSGMLVFKMSLEMAPSDVLNLWCLDINRTDFSIEMPRDRLRPSPRAYHSFRVDRRGRRDKLKCEWCSMVNCIVNHISQKKQQHQFGRQTLPKRCHENLFFVKS